MKKVLVLLLMVACVGVFLQAEEGMWLLDQLHQLELEKKGFEISAAEIYTPEKPSLVNCLVLGFGGTSEIVSPNGLVLTNHHVAFGAVQRASTKGVDLITNGFLAKDLSQEIEAPGYSAEVFRYMKDVTDQFKRYDRIRDLVKRDKAIKRRMQNMKEKIEKGKPDLTARVASMYNGKKYYLFVHKRYDDVRVVYVPPKAIGNYGGDVDNWMWPRHTGDFSFMRIYTGPDGSGRKFHKDNVPLKTDNWIRLSRSHLKEGDQTFILGYPGSTTRYRTSYSVDENLNHNYPDRINLFQEVITLLESFEKDSMIAKMKVAGMIKGLNNVMKNYQGKIEDMKRIDFLARKRQQEKELAAFIQGDEKMKARYGNLLDRIGALYAQRAETRDYDDAFMLSRMLGGTMMGLGIQIYNLAEERAKPEKERDPAFSEKEIARAVSRLHFMLMAYYEPSDKAMLTLALEKADALPKGQRIAALESILNQGKEAFVEKAYKDTKLKDVEFVKTLFAKGMTTAKLKALDDPFINLAAGLYPESEVMRKKNEKFDAEISELRKQYIEALTAWKGGMLYPDANRTLRFTYGKVAGYQARDAVYYKPFTTLTGVIEKHTGEEPFDAPEALRKVHAAGDFGSWMDPDLGDVPVAFVHRCDITGGNSGSPVLNARGEMIGIAFDGNWEAMNGDWQYDNEKQRTISVDIRYVLFVTEKIGKAAHILKELGF
ncbi:MAG: S46 family peptidase [Candidatus Aminicenantes bacterium]|nr:S46 family peptidase [Candidatus Aminicenantes bacterium]